MDKIRILIARWLFGHLIGDHVAELGRVELEAGDILVLQYPEPGPPLEAQARIGRRLRELLPGVEVLILIGEIRAWPIRRLDKKEAV